MSMFMPTPHPIPTAVAVGPYLEAATAAAAATSWPIAAASVTTTTAATLPRRPKRVTLLMTRPQPRGTFKPVHRQSWNPLPVSRHHDHNSQRKIPCNVALPGCDDLFDFWFAEVDVQCEIVTPLQALDLKPDRLDVNPQ